MEKKRVLVADDKMHLRERLKHYFEAIDCIVDLAHSGVSTQKLIREREYDLIVCDNVMPWFEGASPTACAPELLVYTKDRGKGKNRNAHFVVYTADQDVKDLVQRLGGVYVYKDETVHPSESFSSIVSLFAA